MIWVVVFRNRDQRMAVEEWGTKENADNVAIVYRRIGLSPVWVIQLREDGTCVQS